MNSQETDITTIALNWALLQHQVVELITVLYSLSVWGVSHNESACAKCFISALQSKLTSTYEGVQVAQLLADRDAEWGCLLGSNGADLRNWTTPVMSPVPKT